MSLLSGYVLTTTSTGFQCSGILSQRIEAYGQCYVNFDKVTGSAVKSYREYLQLQQAAGGGTDASYTFLRYTFPNNDCSGAPSIASQGPFTAGKCYLNNFGYPTPPNPEANLAISTSFTFSFTPGLSTASIPSLSLTGIVFTSYPSNCLSVPPPIMGASWVFSSNQCYWGSYWGGDASDSKIYTCYTSVPSTYWVNTYKNTPLCNEGPGLHSYTQQQIDFSSCSAGPQAGITDSKYLYLQNSCTNKAATPGPSSLPGLSPRLSTPVRTLTPGALTGIGIALSCFFSCVFALKRRLLQNQRDLQAARDAGAGEPTSNPVAATVAMVPLPSAPVYATAIVVVEDRIPPPSKE